MFPSLNAFIQCNCCVPYGYVRVISFDIWFWFYELYWFPFYVIFWDYMYMILTLEASNTRYIFTIHMLSIYLLSIVQTYDTKARRIKLKPKTLSIFATIFCPLFSLLAKKFERKLISKKIAEPSFLIKFTFGFNLGFHLSFFRKWWFRFEIRRQKRVLFSLHRPHSSNHLKNYYTTQNKWGVKYVVI